MSQQNRPVITNGKIGVGSFGVGIMPDGTSDSLRVLIEPDGFHFIAYDFDDLVLSKILLESPKGNEYNLSFDNAGSLLVNGHKYTTPTNQNDEVIQGNKTYEGITSLTGGLLLSDAEGNEYSIVIGDDGKLNAIKEEN